jgi:hypothetical protein
MFCCNCESQISFLFTSSCLVLVDFILHRTSAGWLAIRIHVGGVVTGIGGLLTSKCCCI